MNAAATFRAMLRKLAGHAIGDEPLPRSVADVKTHIVDLMTTRPPMERKQVVDSYLNTVQTETLLEIRDALYEIAHGVSELRGFAEAIARAEASRWKI